MWAHARILCFTRLWTLWKLIATLEDLGFSSSSSFNFVLSCCGISFSPSRFLIPGWHLVDSPLKWNLNGTWFPICIFILGATSWIALSPVPWILLSHPAELSPDFQPVAHISLYLIGACKCWLLIVATKDAFFNHLETGLGPRTFCCSAAWLAPGRTSPLARKYKETIRN